MKTKTSNASKNGDGFAEKLKGVVPERNGIYRIPIQYIRKYKKQPRKWINQMTIEELAGSMQAVGQLEPGKVRPLFKPEGGFHFELISGERRITACEKANIDFFRTGIDASVKKEIDQFEHAMIVNFCREDPPVMDTAFGIDRLKKEKGFTNEEIARRLGKSKGFVDQHHSLTRLHPDVQAMLHPQLGEKQLPMVVALKLVKYPEDFQLKLAMNITRMEQPELPRMRMVEAIRSIETSRVQSGLTAYEPRPDKSFDALAGFLKRTASQMELYTKTPVAALENTLQGRKGENAQQPLIDLLQVIISEATTLKESITGIVSKMNSPLPVATPKTAAS